MFSLSAGCRLSVGPAWWKMSIWADQQGNAELSQLLQVGDQGGAIWDAESGLHLSKLVCGSGCNSQWFHQKAKNKLGWRCQRAARIGLRSEGPLCAILVSVSVVGGGVGSGFPPPFIGPVPPAHFPPLHETAMLGKSPMYWLVPEKQITVWHP